MLRGETASARMKVKGRGSRSQPISWAGRRSAEDHSGIGLRGGVLSTYPPGPDPWDVW